MEEEEDPESSPAASPQHTTAEPSVMEVQIEEPVQKEESGAENVVASPPSPPAPAPEPTKNTPSPGHGSGTKEVEPEVLITGSHQGPAPGVSQVLAKIVAPEVKVDPSAKGKDPVSSLDLATLDSMSTPALCEEYFSRLAHHKNLETELVSLLQKRYQVLFYLCLTFYLLHNYNLTSPQAPRLSLVDGLGA